MQTHTGQILAHTITKVKTLTRKLGLGFNLWPFDPKVSACRGPAMDYMFTDFGVDSSSRFPFRAQTSRQTDKQADATEHPTHAGGYTAGVGNKTATFIYLLWKSYTEYK